MNYDEILDYPWEFDDVEASNIKEYLEALLLHLWEEGEGFSGKRPFGNSGWEYDIYHPLVVMKCVEGEISENDDLLSINEEQANDLVFNLIEHIFEKK